MAGTRHCTKEPANPVKSSPPISLPAREIVSKTLPTRIVRVSPGD
jgi:hypothetical protein